jgi:hypothetical protein
MNNVNLEKVVQNVPSGRIIQVKFRRLLRKYDVNFDERYVWD